MAEVRDPFTRELLKITTENRANNGDLATEAPDVDVPAQFDDDRSASTGDIRNDLLNLTDARFKANLAEVEQRAIRKRQLRSGITSQRERDTANLAQQERLGLLGEFEERETGRREGFIADLAGIEKSGAETRLNIGAEGTEARKNILTAGEADRATIRTQGTEDRKRIIEEGLQDRLNIDAQTASNIESIMSQGEQDRLLAGEMSDDELKQIQARGEETRKTIGTEAGAQARLVAVQGIQDRLNINEAGANALAEIMTKAEQDRLLAGDMAEDELVQIREIAIIELEQIAARGEIELAKLRLGGKEERKTAELYLSRTDRELALRENQEAARQEIERLRLDLDKKAQEFGFKVTEADMTGIWEAYGSEELDAFTASMPSKAGDAEYNDRYDFDGDGKIDFEDFVSFAKYSAMGGIPTLEAQQLNESVRQFDITTKEGMRQFNEELKTFAAENQLNRDQQWELTKMQLEANLGVAEAQINVQVLGEIVEFLSSPGVIALDDESLDSLTNYIENSAINGDILTDIFSTEDNEAVIMRAKRADTFVKQHPAFKKMGGVELWNAFETMINNGEIAEDDPVLLDYFDLDGDGSVTSTDMIKYSLYKDK